MQTPPFFLAIVLICAALAIMRSPKRLRTALYISGMMLLGGLVGAGIGFLKSPEVAGTFAGLGLQLAGLGASIERLMRYKKPTL